MVKYAIRQFLKNPILANILMVALLFAGYIGSQEMNRELVPNMGVNKLRVRVPYPGASPGEVEDAICVVLENSLENIKGVDEVSVLAYEGGCNADIKCEEQSDISKIKETVKSKVDAITTFPEGAEKPIVTEIEFTERVLRVYLWGDIPENQALEYIKEIKEELAVSCPFITNINLIGNRGSEISIELPEETLRKYDLTLNSVAQSIKRNNLNLSTGSLKTNAEEFRIYVKGKNYNISALAKIPVIVNADGTTVTLGKVAKLKDGFTEGSANHCCRLDGKYCVGLEIKKGNNQDSIKISQAVHEFVDAKQKQLPQGVELAIFQDSSNVITERLDMLLDNGKMGLLLVFLCLWLFMDLRLSFWVTMGIPISLAGGLAIMALCGCTINLLTMFGMIMVLGLIVDDAIVVGESIYAKRQQGESATDAVVNGASEVAIPVAASVLTTIIAFVPLLFVAGNIGKRILQIPIPVITALAVSLLEGLFILPVHLRHLPATTTRARPGFFLFRIPGYLRRLVAATMTGFVERVYAPALSVILTWRYVCLAAAAAIILTCVGLYFDGIVKFVFWQREDRNWLYASITLAPGTPITTTQDVSERVLQAWKKVEKDFQPKIPEGKELTVIFFSNLNQNQVSFFIELLPIQERKIKFIELSNAWRKYVGVIPGAIETSFYETTSTGSTLDIQLMGKDIDDLQAASSELMDKFNSIEGVVDVHTNNPPGKREFIIDIKPEARRLGLSLQDIASQLSYGFYGLEVCKFQREKDEIKVMVRYVAEGNRDSVSFFEDQKIRTNNGEQVPLKYVASIKLSEGQRRIKRQNGKKSIRVYANIDTEKANANEILTLLENDYLPILTSKHNVIYKTQGWARERDKSMGSLYKIGFPFALIGIYLIIATLFRSYIQPVIILLTIPFGMVGAIVGHIIYELPITIMSLFGFVALAGIVINDAIILMEGINARLERGVNFIPAVIEGAKRRFRAIILTTITTFLGLSPLISSKTSQAQGIIPMAITIAYGILAGTFVSLVLIPCFYTILNDLRRLAHVTIHLHFPTREEVEPRYTNGLAMRQDNITSTPSLKITSESA